MVPEMLPQKSRNLLAKAFLTRGQINVLGLAAVMGAGMGCALLMHDLVLWFAVGLRTHWFGVAFDVAMTLGMTVLARRNIWPSRLEAGRDD